MKIQRVKIYSTEFKEQSETKKIHRFILPRKSSLTFNIFLRSNLTYIKSYRFRILFFLFCKYLNIRTFKSIMVYVSMVIYCVESLRIP